VGVDRTGAVFIGNKQVHIHPLTDIQTLIADSSFILELILKVNAIGRCKRLATDVPAGCMALSK